MVGAHVGHNCTIGSNVIIANNCLLGGYVEIQDNAFLGGGCVFHQFIRVGRLAITQGGSAFSVDVPPFTMAALLNYAIGLNVVGLKRAGLTREERDELKAAFKLIYLSGLNTSQALAQAAEKTWSKTAREFFNFITSAKKRGICKYRGSAD
jgi:UDP-N-acetylglucosamine acyltransferase